MAPATALKTRIAAQQRQVQELELQLDSFDAGVQRHMAEVQLRYAYAYLDFLNEQLEHVQGGVDAGSATRLSTHTQAPAAAASVNTVAAAQQAAVDTAAPAARAQRSHTATTWACVSGGTHTATATAEAPTECPKRWPVTDQEWLAALHSCEEESQQTGDAPNAEGWCTSHDTCAAAESSLIDEDDWVCVSSEAATAATGSPQDQGGATQPAATGLHSWVEKLGWSRG